MHSYHEGLDGFDRRQIWYDGCEECEHRGKSLPRSLGSLDNANLRRAWARMLLWCDDDLEGVGEISLAELPLLRFLEACRMVLRRLRLDCEGVDSPNPLDSHFGDVLAQVDRLTTGGEK